MKRSNATLFAKIILFVLFIASLFGCGGAGGAGGFANQLNLFITDDASAQYSGVWVKLYKAELKGEGDKSVVLFQSTEGLTVNLRQLNDGASKFLLLAPGQVPDGTYNKVQFEVDKTVNLVATGSGNPSTAVFPDALNNEAGNSVLALNLNPAIVMPGAGKVVVDFDLKNWDVVNGVITPVLKHHDGTGLEDGSRHERFEFNGMIGSLSGTAPNQSFDLTLKTGGTVKVVTDESTDVTGQGDNAGLVSGRAASIFGVFDPVTNSLKANIIHYISNSEAPDLAKAIGLASNINAEGGSFDIAPKYTKGFAPKGDKVTVNTDGSTIFLGKRGLVLTKDQFFSNLASAGANANVDTMGTYSEGSNSILAKVVHVENEADFGAAEATGKTSNPDSEAKSFDLALTHSEGMNQAGSSVKVQLSPDVEIKGPHGVVTTVDQFFSLLAEKARTVSVKGVFNADTQTLTVGRIEYVVDVTVNFTAKGTTSNPDNQTGVFDFSISQIQGVDLPHDSPLHIAINPNTTYKAQDGSDINQDVFFNLLMAKSKTLTITAKASLPSQDVTIVSIQVMADPIVVQTAKGTTASPNSEMGTFDVALTEVNGFEPADGPMHVQFAEGVQLKGPQGISLNRAQFFSYLNERARNVQLTGTYSDGLFTATKVELKFPS